MKEQELRKYGFSCILAVFCKVLCIKECADIAEKLVLADVAAATAAVVRLIGDFTLRLVENTYISFVSANYCRLAYAHCFECRTGCTYKDITCCDKFGGIGSKTGGKDYLSAVFVFKRSGDLFNVGKQVLLGRDNSVADHDNLKVGISLEQLFCRFRKAKLRFATAFVHTADGYDTVPACAEGQLFCNAASVCIRREHVCVDSVYGNENIVCMLRVVVNKILLYIFTYRHLHIAPVCNTFPERSNLEYPMGGGYEGKVHFFLQKSAYKSRYSCVRMHKIVFFCFYQLFKSFVRFANVYRVFGCKREGNVAYSALFKHFCIFSACRCNSNGVAVFLKRKRKLVYVSFRTAKAHRHCRHQNVKLLFHFSPESIVYF